MTPQAVVEILKLVRYKASSVRMISEETGYSMDTARRWARAFYEMGIVVKTVGPKPIRGHKSALYALAPEWGGPV